MKDLHEWKLELPKGIDDDDVGEAVVPKKKDQTTRTDIQILSDSQQMVDNLVAEKITLHGKLSLIVNGSHSQRRTDKAIAKKVIVFGWETTCATVSHTNFLFFD